MEPGFAEKEWYEQQALCTKRYEEDMKELLRKREEFRAIAAEFQLGSSPAAPLPLFTSVSTKYLSRYSPERVEPHHMGYRDDYRYYYQTNLMTGKTVASLPPHGNERTFNNKIVTYNAEVYQEDENEIQLDGTFADNSQLCRNSTGHVRGCRVNDVIDGDDVWVPQEKVELGNFTIQTYRNIDTERRNALLKTKDCIREFLYKGEWYTVRKRKVGDFTGHVIVHAASQKTYDCIWNPEGEIYVDGDYIVVLVGDYLRTATIYTAITE